MASIPGVKRTWVVMVLMGGGLAASAWGESVTWEASVMQAGEQNAELRAARESVEAARATRNSRYSPFLPQFTAALGYNYGEGATGGSRTYSASVTGTQNLFNGLGDRAQLDQASATLRQSEATLDQTRARVSFDLRASYAGLLYAQRSVKLQEEIIRRRSDNLKLVQLRFESGRENRGSALLSQAYLNQANYELLQAKHAISTAQSQLAKALGRDADAELVASQDLPETDPPIVPDFRAALGFTPEHRQSIAQEEAADAAVTAARAGFFPTLNLTATTGRTGDQWLPPDSRWSIGLSLSFPFFSGGRDYFGTRTALANYSAASLSRVSQDRQLVVKLKQTHAAFVEAVEKYKVDESFLAAAKSRAEIARNKYNNGLLSFDDWDIIENDLISRQRSVLQSQRERAQAEAAWYQALGQGVVP
ncbi:MAG: TolC family protein [Bacteriovoracia bacterium]